MTKYDDITYKINGCAMKVHNLLGNGFQSDRRCGGDLSKVSGY